MRWGTVFSPLLSKLYSEQFVNSNRPQKGTVVLSNAEITKQAIAHNGTVLVSHHAACWIYIPQMSYLWWLRQPFSLYVFWGILRGVACGLYNLLFLRDPQDPLAFSLYFFRGILRGVACGLFIIHFLDGLQKCGLWLFHYTVSGGSSTVWPVAFSLYFFWRILRSVGFSLYFFLGVLRGVAWCCGCSASTTISAHICTRGLLYE